MTFVHVPQFEPEVGSPVFAPYADPAMAHEIVHFVGRQRGRQPLPHGVGHLTTEQRLASILTVRQLYGYHVPRGQGVAVVCLSDLSSAELEAVFDRGINTRGRGWARALHRGPSWELGFRPVVYADKEKLGQHRDERAGLERARRADGDAPHGRSRGLDLGT